MKRAKNQVNRLAVRIQQVLSKLTNDPRAEKPTVACICAELEQLQNEFKESDFNLDTVTVSVITSPITLEGIYLGPFRIQLNIDKISSGAPADCFDVIAMEPHPAADSPHVTHPHVSAERLCTGDATAPLSKALMSGRLCDFFLLIRSVLNAYNSDSPYVPLKEWEGEYHECYDCGLHIQPNESYRCPSCNRWFCKDCITTFPCCDLQICSLCLQDMKHIDRTRCDDCPQRKTLIPDIHEAARLQRLCAVELMIANGADVSFEDNSSRTALRDATLIGMASLLHWAAKHGYISFAKLLIAKGADVNIKNRWCRTPLHVASKYGQTGFAEALLANGCNVNARDDDRRTPLHEAALWNHKEVAKVLLSYGAEVNAKDIFELSPWYLAENQKNSEVATFLSESGAESKKSGDKSKKKSKDQRIRGRSGGSTRLPNHAHGRYTERNNPWQARIRYKGRRLSLGMYETKDGADAAYSRAVSRIDRKLPPTID